MNDSIELYPLIRIHARGQIIIKIKRNCFVPVQDMKEDKLRMQYLVELMQAIENLHNCRHIQRKPHRKPVQNQNESV